MRYVDFDLAAARHAAARCRSGADELRALAERTGTGVYALRWQGGDATRARNEVSALVATMRAEASRLDATAERIDTAAVTAQRLDWTRGEAAAAAARRAEECPATATGPTWGQG